MAVLVVVVVPVEVMDQVLQLLVLLLLVVVAEGDTNTQTEIEVVRAVVVAVQRADQAVDQVYQAKVMQVVVDITMVVNQAPLLKRVEEEAPQVLAHAGKLLLLALLGEAIGDVADVAKHLQ